MRIPRAAWWTGFAAWTTLASACELCAVYNASNVTGDSVSGFLFTISEQYLPQDTPYFEGSRIPKSILDAVRLDSSITRLVAGYNFSPAFGLNLNVPIIERQFYRYQLAPDGLHTESGTVAGLGDAALIGRWRAWRYDKMSRAITVNLLAGVKLPTGDASRIRDEINQDLALGAIYGLGHDHFVGGAHEHDLALGSGSWDGIFGATINARWDRYFAAAQLQYYLRTSGEASFRFGDELMISGGPGAYLILGQNFSLSAQANAVYDTVAESVALGQPSGQTGMTAWYFGPLLSFTWGRHFSGNAGVDLPLRVYEHGLQNIPSYVAHGALTWRF